MANNKFEMIMCIVNTGFSETVMDAAKEVGARGGTVIHARGTANKEAEQFFQITIQPDVVGITSQKTADLINEKIAAQKAVELEQTENSDIKNADDATKK